MKDNIILFIVIIALSAISLIASIGVSLYYKRRKFYIKNGKSVSVLAKRFTTVSVAVTAGVFVALGITLLSGFGLPAFMFMGLILFFIMCGCSIIIGPAVSLLGIVFSAVSVKKHDGGKRTYIFLSCLSMLVSFTVIYLYALLNL